MMQRVVHTIDAIAASRHKTVCYLSAEFLLGPHLENNLVSLGIRAEVARATAELGLDIDALIDQEEEPGLGNGGLGRLAACYLDSLSALEIPAIGYGIRPLVDNLLGSDPFLVLADSPTRTASQLWKRRLPTSTAGRACRC
jgi:starch phosphorylase